MKLVLTVDTSALKVTKQRFKKMQERAKNPKKFMDVVGAKAWKDVLNSFTIEQNEDGTSWKPLKKARKRGGSKILQDTGRLRSGNRWAASNTEARVFNKVKYGVYHNSDKPRKKLPRRQFMWISDKLKVKFLTDLLSFIKG
jgi:phage gpG-like protein